MSTSDVLRLATNLTYLGCLVIAVRMAIRQRTAQTRWLVTLFAAIDVAIVVGLVRGVDAEPLASPWQQLLIVMLLVFPWGLLRFADSLIGISGWARRLGDAGLIAMAAFTLVPGVVQGDPDLARTALQNGYLVGFLAVWGGQTIGASIVLFRGRRGQATVVRRRLRMLSLATLLIGLALFAGVGSDDESSSDDATASEAAADEPASTSDVTAGQLIGQLLGALSGVMFLIGFAPPRLLRSAWRHDDERNLYDVAVGFLTVVSVEEVHARLLPGLRSVLGAPAVALLDDDGTPVAVDGTQDTDWIGDARRLQLHDRDLAVMMSPRMPLLGEDEQELVDRLGLLTALATDRARLIVAERAAHARVEEGNRKLAALNSELEAFLYSTSHDLKNPVIALLGYISLLQSEYADALPKDAQYYLERMAANSRQMEALINDLLELSRIGRVEAPPQPVAVDAVIDGLVADLGQRHPLAVVERGGLPTLTMSPQRLTQLFDNLITNACRYAGRDDVHVAISFHRDPKTADIVLEVRDNGEGIPADQLERVFGMFERLHPNVEGGTGMGLAICRRIVEHVGGTITAVPGSGATFEIRLPAQLLVPSPDPATVEVARGTS